MTLPYPDFPNICLRELTYPNSSSPLYTREHTFHRIQTIKSLKIFRTKLMVENEYTLLEFLYISFVYNYFTLDFTTPCAVWINFLFAPRNLKILADISKKV